MQQAAYRNVAKVHQLARSDIFRTLHTHNVREFPPAVATHLNQHGHASFDGVLSLSTTAALRAEIDTLASRGHLRINTTHIVKSGSPTRTFPKRHVYEAELNLLPPDLLESLPALNTLRHDATIRTLLSVFTPRMTLHSHAIKIQRSDGLSACFPVHVDSAPSQDSRMVTALLYLNEDWEEAHGGQLRIYDSPLNFCDIAPCEGRLVLLASTGMHHRVLPAQKPKYVVTMWCSGSVRPCTARDSQDMSIDERVAVCLLQPKYRDMAFRLVLVDEWERSLWEAHEKDVAADAVQMHRTNLGLIRTRLPAVLCKDLQLTNQVNRVERLIADPQCLEDTFRLVKSKDASMMSFHW